MTMEIHVPHAPAGKGRIARLEGWVAVFIALTSLAITLYEARVTREHDRMSVWPRLYQESSDSAGIYDRVITNVGLGPALVKSFEVRLDDTRRTSWKPVVSSLLAGANQNPGFFFSHVGAGTVILPGHTIHVLTIVGRDFSSLAIAQDHRLVSQLCYCSLYDECWTGSSNRAEPVTVRTCAGVSDTTSIAP
jgi:hypothetical protein